MISLSHIYKTYSSSCHALKNISVEIERGEFCFLTGPSGAGKSTLFRLLTASEKPTSGRLSVCGYSLTSLPYSKVPFLRRQMGVVFQDFKLLSDRTVFENVALPLQILSESTSQIRRRVGDILDQVGLSDKWDQYPEFLSGGEQQRVSIARALVHRPGLVIADEPTGNLDPNMSMEVMNLFRDANSHGTTVFIATHDLSHIKRLNKRTIHLIKGEQKREASNENQLAAL